MTRCAACGDVHDADATICPRLRVAITAGVCGTRIERYDIERYVGGGGFGAVYLARHALLGQAVAIKLLRREVATNAAVVARFLREARAAASIDSPHVVELGPIRGSEALVVDATVTGGAGLDTRPTPRCARCRGAALRQPRDRCDRLRAAPARAHDDRDLAGPRAAFPLSCAPQSCVAVSRRARSRPCGNHQP